MDSLSTSLLGQAKANAETVAKPQAADEAREAIAMMEAALRKPATEIKAEQDAYMFSYARGQSLRHVVVLASFFATSHRFLQVRIHV